MAVGFPFKLIVCRFLYVKISCLIPNPKVGGRRIHGNGELFIVFGYVLPASTIRTILVNRYGAELLDISASVKGG